MSGPITKASDDGKEALSDHVILDKGGCETQPLTGGGLKRSRSRKSRQVRVRLSPELQDHFRNHPAPIRNRVITLILEASLGGLDVRNLVNLTSELRKVSLELHTINQVALLRGVPINAPQVNEAIRRLNLLLGDKL